jgi:hypothetical protein
MEKSTVTVLTYIYGIQLLIKFFKCNLTFSRRQNLNTFGADRAFGKGREEMTIVLYFKQVKDRCSFQEMLTLH